MQKFTNKIKTLQQFCEECITKNYDVLEQFEKQKVSRRSRQTKQPFIQPIFGNSLMKMMLMSSDPTLPDPFLNEPAIEENDLYPARNIDDILGMYCDSNKCGIQQIAIRNQQMNFEAIEKFIANQTSLAHLKISWCKITNCPITNAVLLLCKEHLVTFHLQVVEHPTKLPNHPPIHSNACYIISKTSHPKLKCLRFGGVDCAWYMIMNKEDLPEINFIELSYYNKEQITPHEVQRFVEPRDQVVRRENPLLQLYRINLLKSTLKSLVLHNTIIYPDDMDMLFELQNLELLDLSLSLKPTAHEFEDLSRPSIKLHHLVDKFPKLRSLDVSSTQIGNNLYEDSLSHGEPRSFWDVFANRKLDFLGLLNCTGCEFLGVHHIANEVAGTASVMQLVTALEKYMDRIHELTYVSKKLFQQDYEPVPEYNVKVIKLLMQAVERYPTNEPLLANLCVNIYGMVRSDYIHFNLFQKRELIRFIVEIINTEGQIYQASNRVIRVAILTLEHFNLPIDAGSDFPLVIDKLVTALIIWSEGTIGSVAIHVCNMIVCSTEQDTKELLSETNFVESIIAVIKKKLSNGICDDVMTSSWGTLWNVSDETPSNSEKFIQLGGIELMIECFERFSTNEDLRKSAVGLVGNIAEVKSLRPFFMKEKLLNLFVEWSSRKNSNNDIELSYHACGTLSHLLSDGEDAWTVQLPKRDSVKNIIYQSINSWNLDAQRQVNYRSFLPILGLVHCGVKEASHWAVWALCNLIKYDGDYRRVLEREGAFEILSQVTIERDFYENTVNLARKVLEIMGVRQSAGFVRR